MSTSSFVASLSNLTVTAQVSPSTGSHKAVAFADQTSHPATAGITLMTDKQPVLP